VINELKQMKNKQSRIDRDKTDMTNSIKQKKKDIEGDSERAPKAWPSLAGGARPFKGYLS
jgi:hypothetical protein